MPELPEIMIIRDDLIKVLPGKKVVKIDTFHDYSLNPTKTHFDEYVLGNTFIDVLNIAKLLVLKMSSGYYLVVHLKMTGNILYNTQDKYIKISLTLDDGKKLHYSTVRKLGYFEVWDQNKLDTYASKLGKTVLESNLEPQEFISLIQRKNTIIRNALLDQNLVSGIGNIYANDALYLSKIHPKAFAKGLSTSRLAALFYNLKKVMIHSLKNRGSSMNRYKDIYGVSGTHQDHFLVYGKKGNCCTQCKSAVIEFEKVQGRGIYFCPNCQILS